MSGFIARHLPALGIALALLVGAVLYVLTLHPSQEDPCAYPDSDVSAAILEDDRDAADALANRAIVQRGACDRRSE